MEEEESRVLVKNARILAGGFLAFFLLNVLNSSYSTVMALIFSRLVHQLRPEPQLRNPPKALRRRDGREGIRGAEHLRLVRGPCPTLPPRLRQGHDILILGRLDDPLPPHVSRRRPEPFPEKPKRTRAGLVKNLKAVQSHFGWIHLLVM